MQLNLFKASGSNLFNLIAFNLMWVGCVVGREQWLDVVAVAVLAYMTLLLARREVRPAQLLIPALIGICIDSVLTLAGIFEFSSGSRLLPLWLVVLWLAFASALAKSLAVFGKNKLLAAGLGAIVFPLNYAVGERLGAVTFAHGQLNALISLSIIWAFCLPLLYTISEGKLEQKNVPT